MLDKQLIVCYQLCLPACAPKQWKGNLNNICAVQQILRVGISGNTISITTIHTVKMGGRYYT